MSSLHPGVTLEEMRQLTGFEFRAPALTPETPVLTDEERRLLYGPVKEKLVRAYPQFAARLHRRLSGAIAICSCRLYRCVVDAAGGRGPRALRELGKLRLNLEGGELPHV